MESINYCLDEILRRLNKDREVPITQRNHLNPDIILREIIKTDRHEDFYEMMDILKEDGFIKKVNEEENIAKIDKYRDCLITMKGSAFIEKGGYSQQSLDAASENTRLKALEISQTEQGKTLNRLTGWIAGGTIALALIELWKMALDYHWFSCS